MFRYLKYRLELFKLRKILSKEENELEHALENAKRAGYDDGTLSFLEQQNEETENWIRFHQTQYLSSICDALIIPMPENTESGEYYFEFNFDDLEGDRRILTKRGMHVARTRIREEKKIRREAFGFWVSMIIGVIGAFIGLISTLKK
ncbi:MAG: hypothetical protein EPO06_06525 [Burkholderiaceae bacterium]|nr:MAG: hypothetical protein EPO06_06525 [Burkholderiaceae bacterium]